MPNALVPTRVITLNRYQAAAVGGIFALGSMATAALLFSAGKAIGAWAAGAAVQLRDAYRRTKGAQRAAREAHQRTKKAQRTGARRTCPPRKTKRTA